MRWVTTHPAGDDFTWEQRSAREFKEASPGAFFQRKAKLEEQQPPVKPAPVPPATVRPKFNGPGACPTCKTVVEKRDEPQGSVLEDMENFVGTQVGVKFFLDHPTKCFVPDEVKAKLMIARAIRRLPMEDTFRLFREACFVVPSASGSTWVSANVADNRHVVVIDRGLMTQPEEEQVAAILPLVARVLVNARHPLDTPSNLAPDLSLCFCQTCGEPKAENRPSTEGRTEAYERTLAAYKKQATDGEKLAGELVADWQEKWRDPATRPTRPRSERAADDHAAAAPLATSA